MIPKRHFQDPDADIDLNEKIVIPKDAAEKMAKDSFDAVFQHGPKVQLDHHLVYYARKSTHLRDLSLK